MEKTGMIAAIHLSRPTPETPTSECRARECAIKGKNLVVPFIEPHASLSKDTADNLIEICTKSFIKRPALKDIAMTTVASFMNNLVFQEQGGDGQLLVNAAAVFGIEDKMRVVPFGTTRVVIFGEEGVVYETPLKEYPRLGEGPVITPEVSEVIELPKGRNALLMCSKSLTDHLSNEQLKALLDDAGSSEEWMERIEGALDGFTDYNAQCIVMPEPKKGFGFRKD